MEETKVCNKCKIEKPISDFSKKNKLKDGTQRYQSICKECFNKNDAVRRSTDEYKKYKKEYGHTYHIENNEKISNNKKEYHIKNKEKILKKKKEYRNENKDKIKEYFNKNKDKIRNAQRTYRKKYPHIVAWRRILYRTLYYLGTKKEGHTQDILGYSAVQLKHRIESQFVEGMHWGNYGEWEIDHIRPLTSFDMNSDPSIVNSLDNLQPLWKEDNMSKFNHIY